MLLHRITLTLLGLFLLTPSYNALAAQAPPQDDRFEPPVHRKKDKKGDAESTPSTAGPTKASKKKAEELGPSDMIPPPTPLSKVIIVDQQRVHMIEAGWDKPEVLIVLPGFLEPAVACQKVLDPLSKRFHVMVIDPQGFGFSGGPNWVSYSPQGMAQFVLRLMDHLQLKKVHLAGFDLGAAATVRFAYDNPDRLYSVVIGAGPLVPDQYTGLLADAQVPLQGDQVMNGLQGRTKKYLQEGLFDKGRYDDQLAEDLYSYYKSRETKKYLLDWINNTGSDLYKMQDWFERLEMPVFILWGASDPFFPVGQADELVHRFPDARLKVVGEAGHFLLLEQPNAVSAAMVEYVYEPPPPPPPFSGLGFTAYRGQASHRYFLLRNHLEKPVKVTCEFSGIWGDLAGNEITADNIQLDPAEEFEIEAGESFEVSIGVSMADRNLTVETIYVSAVSCTAMERKTEHELLPLPIRLQIPQLGEDMPEGFEAKALGESYEMDIGTPSMDDLIEVE